jgi:hypothetical protein
MTSPAPRVEYVYEASAKPETASRLRGALLSAALLSAALLSATWAAALDTRPTIAGTTMPIILVSIVVPREGDGSAAGCAKT